MFEDKVTKLELDELELPHDIDQYVDSKYKHISDEDNNFQQSNGKHGNQKLGTKEVDSEKDQISDGFSSNDIIDRNENSDREMKFQE